MRDFLGLSSGNRPIANVTNSAQAQRQGQINELAGGENTQIMENHCGDKHAQKKEATGHFI